MRRQETELRQTGNNRLPVMAAITICQIECRFSVLKRKKDEDAFGAGSELVKLPTRLTWGRLGESRKRRQDEDEKNIEERQSKHSARYSGNHQLAGD